MHVSMTPLSAEVAYDSALTQQLLKKPRTLGDYMEIEKQLRAATAEIERLYARVRELESERNVILEDNARLRAELAAAKADSITAQLQRLTDEQRMEIFREFCASCGAHDPRCQCWNDE